MKYCPFAICFLLFVTYFFPGCSGKKPMHGDAKLAAADTASVFLFVAHDANGTGLWLHDLNTHKSFLMKADRGEIVAETATNEKHDHAYFITVNKYGREGVLPFFVNAKFYVIDLKTYTVSKPVKLGNGVQLSAYWDDDTTVSMAINTIQSAMSSHVMQQRLLFSASGRLKHDESQLYDFTRVGFPLLPRERVRLLSPGKTFSIDLNDKNAVFLHGGVENPKLLVGESSERLAAVRWATDGEYLIFSTRDLTSTNKTLRTGAPQTSSLHLFSLADNGMVASFRGSGYKHFDVIRDMVIYDDNFGKSSRIHVYDTRLKKETETIKFAEGCGLQNIPEFPDYGK